MKQEQINELLKELMELTKNDKNGFYSWYAGQSDLEEVKRIFELEFRQRNTHRTDDEKVTKEEFAKWLLDNVKTEKELEAKSSELAPSYKEALINAYDGNLGYLALLNKKPMRKLISEAKTEIEEKAIKKAYRLLLRDARGEAGVMKQSNPIVTGPIYDDDSKPTYMEW